jgi:phosphoribosylglycinamide formyltransferase-1
MAVPIYRIAIFASGNGTNAERLFHHFKNHEKIEVSLVLSNNPSAYVLTRAESAGVASAVFNREQLKEGEVLDWLKKSEITHLVLAGFLWLIPDNLIKAFPNKIINIHPALLPKFGGKGMYGAKVHEAVKAANENETGITIHLVNEHYDDGAVLFQARTSIDSSDTPDQIAAKVHQLEYQYYPSTVEGWVLKK